MLTRCARHFLCLMKYRPTHNAMALRPFSRALSCGKKIHCRARAGAGWCKYSSHSRNATAAALAMKMPPSAPRSVVGVPGRVLMLGVARLGNAGAPDRRAPSNYGSLGTAAHTVGKDGFAVVGFIDARLDAPRRESTHSLTGSASPSPPPLHYKTAHTPQ